MKAKSKPPKQCKGCTFFWNGGVKDGKHNRWCCQYGKPAVDVQTHCIQHGGFKEK